MSEAIAVLLLFVAVTLLYGASQVRGRSRHSLLESTWRSRLARAFASVTVIGSGWVWRGVESGAAAALLVLGGLMVIGMVVTLLGAVAPRAVWGGALLAAVAAPLLALLGGSS